MTLSRSPLSRVLVLVLLCSVSTGCSNMEIQVVPVEAEKPPGDYQLGPEDVLFVSVWGEEDLTLEVTIRPDGKLSLPLIPDLQAEGLTALGLRDEITTRLQEYVHEPNVSVVVVQANNFSVFLLGDIVNPGQYRLRNHTTLVQVISMAGGFTDFAQPNGTKIIRYHDHVREVIPVPVNDIIKNGEVEKDLWLMPGDTILVP